MRTLLVVLAVVGLPPVALAQPATKDSKATEVSELVVGARKATEVSGLTVDSNCRIPAPAREWPTAWFDAPSDPKNKRTEESAGTRAFILKLIADIRNDTPDYPHYGGQLAREMRYKLPLTRRWLVCRGAFKDIRFLHVSRTGYDDFEVDFSTGAIEWEIKPLNAHQVAEQTAIRFFSPQPVTRQFEDFLKSAEQGRPQYAYLTPSAAAPFQAQWPALKAAQEAWGRRQAIQFGRQESDGAYVYIVTYEARQVVWNVYPQDAEGRFTGLKYDAGPD